MCTEVLQFLSDLKLPHGKPFPQLSLEEVPNEKHLTPWPTQHLASSSGLLKPGMQSVQKQTFPLDLPQGSQSLFRYCNVFFPYSYSSWLSGSNKEAHMDHEAKFLQALSFYMPTTVRQPPQQTSNSSLFLLLKVTMPSGDRTCQASASMPIHHLHHH